MISDCFNGGASRDRAPGQLKTGTLLIFAGTHNIQIAQTPCNAGFIVRLLCGDFAQHNYFLLSPDPLFRQKRWAEAYCFILSWTFTTFELPIVRDALPRLPADRSTHTPAIGRCERGSDISLAGGSAA